MDVLEKLGILTDAAKYDVACTSSGTERSGKVASSLNGGIGSAARMGICHAFAGDGRCISLLKILLSNECVYDCKYCVNRISNDVKRATFTPDEIADLTINFYKRNYIEGLFLSSAIVKNPNYTMELMCETIRQVREEHKFNGYIHAKAIPGADQLLVQRMGNMVDRLSVNIEMPSEQSLKEFAPQKSKNAILKPMGEIRNKIIENKSELILYKRATKFAPAGQSTQMIIGASPETDRNIINLSQGLYDKYRLKRVFYSAYIPVGNHPALPNSKPPLLREHRLYQADWLMRFYGFKADEILDDNNPNFHEKLDPKCSWALNNIHLFPIEINRADYNMLLRVPGIGLRSAQRIIKARKMGSLSFENLKKIGVVLKRARFFILCNGKYYNDIKINQNNIENNMIVESALKPDFKENNFTQLTMFDNPLLLPTREDRLKSLTGEL